MCVCVADCYGAAAGYQFRVGRSTDAMHEKDSPSTNIAMKFYLRTSFIQGQLNVYFNGLSTT